MEGQYFHSECRGCVSFGTECDPSCEYDDDPGDRSACFKTADQQGSLDRATMTAPEEAALIMQDPATSFWLRDALRALFDRDPVDALSDTEALVEIMRKNLNEIQGLSR